MSRDVSVWLTREIDLEEVVATVDGAIIDGFGNVGFEGGHWQVFVGPVDRSNWKTCPISSWHSILRSPVSPGSTLKGRAEVRAPRDTASDFPFT